MKRKLAIPSISTAPTVDPQGSKYRDRAAERREAFNQPDRPSAAELAANAVPDPRILRRKHADGPAPQPAPAPPPEPVVEPGKDEKNVGNQLLAKMGWASGAGLGREGEGRVDPVAVQQFGQRAGLGSSKGVEASKWAAQDWRERGKEAAWSRFDAGEEKK